MKRSRYTEEQIIGILREEEAVTPVTELCRKHGMSDATFYTWKSRYGGLEVNEAKGLRALEAENAKLKRLLADAMLDNAALKELLGKMATPAAGHEAVAHLRGEFAMSERRACRVVAVKVERALPAPAA
jgi:putative transposase